MTVVANKLSYVTIDMSTHFLSEVEPEIEKLTGQHSGRRSFLHKKGIIIGKTGELLFCKLKGAQLVDSFHFDCLLYGERVEVKTCNLEVPNKPRWYHWCKVAASNHTQECDHYAFLRMDNDRTRAYYLGSIPKWQFDRDARFFAEGELDPYPPHKPFPEACYAVEASKLRHPEPHYIRI